MKYHNQSLLKRVLQLARPYWLNIFGIFLLNLAAAPLALLSPIPLKMVVDNAFGKHPLPGAVTFFFPGDFVFTFSAVVLIATALMILI